MNVECVVECVGTAVAVGDVECVGRSGGGGVNEGVSAPWSPCDGFQHNKGVCGCIGAAVGGPHDTRIGGRESEGDFLFQGIGTGTSGDAADEPHGIGAGFMVDGGGMVLCRRGAVAKEPEGMLGTFAGADGIDAVHRDGALVGE